MALSDRKIIRILELVPHLDRVHAAVHLGSRGEYCGTLGPVEHPHLDRALVCDLAHDAAQRIDFSYELALGRAADARIAGKVCKAVQRQREQYRVKAELRTRICSLAACVSRTYDRDVVISCVVAQFYSERFFYGHLICLCRILRRSCRQELPIPSFRLPHLSRQGRILRRQSRSRYRRNPP